MRRSPRTSSRGFPPLRHRGGAAQVPGEVRGEHEHGAGAGDAAVQPAADHHPESLQQLEKAIAGLSVRSAELETCSTPWPARCPRCGWRNRFEFKPLASYVEDLLRGWTCSTGVQERAAQHLLDQRFFTELHHRGAAKLRAATGTPIATVGYEMEMLDVDPGSTPARRRRASTCTACSWRVRVGRGEELLAESRPKVLFESRVSGLPPLLSQMREFPDYACPVYRTREEGRAGDHGAPRTSS